MNYFEERKLESDIERHKKGSKVLVIHSSQPNSKIGSSHRAQFVKTNIFTVDRVGLGVLLTVFLDILGLRFFQMTVCQEGVNVY